MTPVAGPGIPNPILKKTLSESLTLQALNFWEKKKQGKPRKKAKVFSLSGNAKILGKERKNAQKKARKIGKQKKQIEKKQELEGQG